MGTPSTIAKFIGFSESTIHTVKTQDLMEGDVILVPGKGKRAVRLNPAGQITLVFPKSGKPSLDGRLAGSLADLGQHAPAVVGRLEGGWVDGAVAQKAVREAHKPKAATVAKPAKLDLRTKEGRAWKAAQVAETVAAPSDNSTHLANAITALTATLDALQQIKL